ncbi:quinoprotein relay system zinc metallohydrolase 2 [Oharaeibacter diazotrophicus]|uniref:Quinoprotein relay system zinc metallohydrolase 2 n=1 Tax=Oharaeibacter diazotrophicus TaxID=1920512 RepID=A0A4R6RNZ6_9HYPH|nr:quinoprotein relay system zinc metallohydrolase 2 [Oharaeibacter diazotrophicus]TDP87556.1 quinoprotein relay system zinc metallohydrolase 2 [Oharaeibacter diazotrophicus]
MLLLAITGAIGRATAEPLPVVEVADGVFAFQGVHAEMNAANRGGIANIGFVIGHDAVAVIDTGGSVEEGRRLLEAIRLRTDLPVKWVVLTHMHPDHVFGTAAFGGQDAAVVAHAHLNVALEARFDHYLAANRAVMGEALLEGVVRVPATVEVADTRTIDLGGRVLDLVAWPVSHTDNDLTVYDRATRTLFSGDLVFLGHTPSLDGSLVGWLRTLDRLAAVPALRVVPGHGPVPSPWPAAIEPERHYFEVLAADVRAAIAAGTPLSAAVGTIGRSEAGKWELFDDFNARNATAAFAELEWE